MALVPMTEILNGPGRGWALGSFITFNMEMTEAILEAAAEEHSPVIIMIYLPFFQQHGKALVPMIRSLAEGVRVPVCLHLDHGQDLGQIMQAIQMGFSSVMIDASTLPLDANIAVTRKVVEVAHLCGVSVEAELGHVPGGEQYLGQEAVGEQKTDPETAGRFVAETGVDALAIAVGNVQGAGSGTAHIDIERIAQIRDKTAALLVLHGGTALTDAEVTQAIGTGIDKINYFTDLRRAYSRGLLEAIDNDPDNAEPEHVMASAKSRVKEIVKAKINLFGSSGEAKAVEGGCPGREILCGSV